MNIEQLRAQIAALQDATMDENRNFLSGYHEGKFDALSAVDALLDSTQDEPVIITEEILKKNGFALNPRPRYKEPFWSKLFTASDGRMYYFKINMEQKIREILMTVMPLASNKPSQPTCYLPHPKTIQQLEKSLRLFNIKYVIKV